MAEQPATPTPQPRPPRRSLISVLSAAIRHLTVRVYAAVILLVVIWTGYTAVAFLVRSVFKPTEVPPQFLTWNTALSGGKLRPENAAGEVNVPRSPLEHYHQVDRTLPADLGNGCITSGCHSPLAHTKRKEIRAFANLHATFLSCMICHDETITGPLEAAWISLDDGAPTEVPAALRLLAHFELNAEKIQSAPAEFHGPVAELLPRVVSISRDSALEHLQTEVNTTEPGSPTWRHAMTLLAGELPNHVRGEYGSKLATKTTGDAYRQYNQHLIELAARYRESTESIPERKRLHNDIHKGVLAKPSACLTCHGGQPARLDFAALGYPPERAKALSDSTIARQMQAILKGEPFYLPKFLEGDHAR